MTLPSKVTESSSLNSFSSGDSRDLDPDDHPDPEGVIYERIETKHSPSTPIAEDALHHHQQQQQQQPVPVVLPQHQDEVKACKVCGDTATGMYFGALVCVPCKTFFLRYAGEGFAYECKNNKNCEVRTSTRTQCKFCRYQKCLQVGMCRRVRPAQVEAQDGQQLCVVCQDVANGVHFGVLTCEGCKKFFRRGLTEQKSYRCRFNQNCSINPSNRNACRYCRFKKCIEVGMSRAAIQMGRPSKMSVIEGGHPRSHGKNGDRSPRESGSLPPPPLSGSSGPSQSETRMNQNHGAFLPWIKDPLRITAPVDNGRESWSKRFDRGSTGMPVWSTGVLARTGSDDGERSVGPDSTMVQERSDHFRQVGFPLGQRTLSSGDEDHFPDWTRGRDGDVRQNPARAYASGSRDLSPVRFPTQLKLEVGSSDDEGPSTGNKRVRYARWRPRAASDDIPPQDDGDDLDAQTMCSSSAGKLDFSGPFPAQGQGLGRPGGVSPSEFLAAVGNVGLYVGPMKPRLHPNPYSAGAIEDYIPNPSVSDTSARAVQSVSTGSPSITSSSNHPLEGPLGSTRLRSCSGCEFGGRRFDSASGAEFPGERDETGASASDPGSKCSSGDGEPGTPVDEVGNQCWRIIQQVIPAYHRFVSAGSAINLQLKEAHEVWKRENPRSGSADELSFWIQTTVVPAYTTVSVAYCKCLPDFTDLCVVDQRILVAGGQSQSRILAAALNWYDIGEKKFRNFLSWRAEGPHRADVFKGKLRAFAERVSGLHLDPVEAALLNALGMFNPDYPALQDRGAIEAAREKILTTMKSYIAANNGSPVERLESLWGVLREAQVLGAEHVALTNTRTLGLPSDGKRNRTTALEDPEATVGQPPTSEKSPTFEGQATNYDLQTTLEPSSKRHVTRSSESSRPEVPECPSPMETEPSPSGRQRDGESSPGGETTNVETEAPRGTGPHRQLLPIPDSHSEDDLTLTLTSPSSSADVL